MLLLFFFSSKIGHIWAWIAKEKQRTRKGEWSLYDVKVIYRKRSVQWDCLYSANIQQTSLVVASKGHVYWTFRIMELLKGYAIIILVHLHEFFFSQFKKNECIDITFRHWNWMPTNQNKRQQNLMKQQRRIIWIH